MDGKQSVERVLTQMREKLGEKYSIDDMARTAMFSKFHFTRIFQEATGVSPARFLSALRLEEAKRLLIRTSLSVADICHQVGYNSPGTFSSRFSACIGVSPTLYRQNSGVVLDVLAGPRPNITDRRGVTLRGHIVGPAGFDRGPIFTGLFRDRVPQGRPVSCAVLGRPGAYVLRNVPFGTWYLLAHAVVPGRKPDFSGAGVSGAPDGERLRLVGASAPITIRPDIPAVSQEIVLRPMGVFDPPVLLALPETWEATRDVERADVS